VLHLLLLKRSAANPSIARTEGATAPKPDT